MPLIGIGIGIAFQPLTPEAPSGESVNLLTESGDVLTTEAGDSLKTEGS